ncbi:MAG: HAMP domain-containing histidine kinase [Ruminococcaceae bacterium]|nr:HAMP domain-containing histidine kinase [Oscillospiraceae bacterium]
MTPTYNNTKKPRTLAAKIFVSFAFFTLIVLVLLWLMQVVFLDDVYRTVKLHDLKNCAEFVGDTVSERETDRGVMEGSKKYNACISVYRITGQSGVVEASSHIKTTCMIHNISSPSLLNEMYTGAADGSTYIKRVELTVNDENVMNSGTSAKGPSAVICSKVVTLGNTDYLILVDDEILPLASTSRTLTYQLIFITAVLLMVAALLSFFLADRITGPFKKMTEKAGRLAEGDYNVKFDGQSFLEAKQLGDTLTYAASELSKLDVMQKELIANISHDLRTPLTLISGYSEVMRDIPGEMTAENMQVIIDETARLSSLVSDLLELSRLTEGKQYIETAPFSITKTVEETVSRYSHLTQKDGYTVEFIAESEAYISADKTRVLQVLYNLINNAVNYTGEDKKVTVVQTVENGIVRISVKDTGEGIPPEMLSMIWERYYKAGDFHKRGKVGTGLGLSIVKKILVMHGANFGVSSEVGKGSTFWFEFPEVTEQV